MKSGHVNKAGTVSFEAPEIFENFPKNEASDVYSFRMLMYELLFPSIGHPWESVCKSSNPQVVSASIMQAVKCGRRPPVEDSLSNDHFIVTIKKCWDEDPKNRPLIPSIILDIQNLQVKYLKFASVLKICKLIRTS